MMLIPVPLDQAFCAHTQVPAGANADSLAPATASQSRISRPQQQATVRSQAQATEHQAYEFARQEPPRITHHQRRALPPAA